MSALTLAALTEDELHAVAAALNADITTAARDWGTDALVRRPAYFSSALRDTIQTLEEIAARHGGHVALTGGVLYREGHRKDLDLLIYRSMDEPEFDWQGFWMEARLAPGAKLVFVKDFGFCKKALLVRGPFVTRVDVFDPFAGGNYNANSELFTGDIS